MVDFTHFWGWDYYPEADSISHAVRSQSKSRMICFHDAPEEDIKPKQLKRSLLYRDPDSPVLYGDREILHLRMEAVAHPMVKNIYDGFVGLSEFKGTCETQDNWFVIFKWWSNGHRFHAYRVGGLRGYNAGQDFVDGLVIDFDTNTFVSRSMSLELEDYPQSWESWANDLEEWCQSVSELPWDYNEDRLPQWYIHRAIEVGEIEYPVLPPGDLRDVFKAYYPKTYSVNAVLTRLFTQATEKLIICDNNLANLNELKGYLDGLRKGQLRNLWDTWLSDVDDASLSTSHNGLQSPLRVLGKYGSKGWLSFRYLWKTTQMDANQAVDALLKGYVFNLKEGTRMHPLRSNLTLDDCQFHLKLRVAYSQKDLILSLANQIRRFGLLPDAHVIWDSIPFSFVADWFLPIDERLSAFDEYAYARAYDILEGLVSVKRSKVIEISGMSVTFTEYSRYFQPTFPEWDWVDDSSGVPITRHLNHNADSMALIVSSFH